MCSILDIVSQAVSAGCHSHDPLTVLAAIAALIVSNPPVALRDRLPGAPSRSDDILVWVLKLLTVFLWLLGLLFLAANGLIEPVNTD